MGIKESYYSWRVARLLSQHSKKGIYSPFQASQLFEGFVSGATALAHYDLIPEAVSTVEIKGNLDLYFQNKFGRFNIKRVGSSWGTKEIVILDISFWEPAYKIATPLRAIYDLARDQGKIWKNREEMLKDLRIENPELINFEDLEEYILLSSKSVILINLLY